MALFKTQKTGFYFFLILLLSILFLQFLLISQEKNLLFKGVYFISGGIQSIKYQIHSSLTETIRKYAFLLEIREENKELREQALKLQAKQSLFNELKRENDRLNKMMAFTLRKDLELLPGQVIAHDLLFQNPLIVINRGAVHGVKKYMGVIHPQGVIGHIFRVTSHSSQVVTLMNKLSSLPGLNQRNRIKGLIEPHKPNLLKFKYFDLQESVRTLKEGDKIVTAQSKHFPSGFPIGTVALVKKETPDSAKQSVLLRPDIRFSSVEEVFVILNWQQGKNP